MKTIVSFFTRLCEKYLPDAFGFCLILTLIVFVAACSFTPYSPLKILIAWGDNLWALNGFAFQMAMVLVLGHMLAQAPSIRRGLRGLASLPKTPGSALVLLTIVSIIACWINWGMGLMLAALMARETGKRFQKIPFGLVVATGYAGFVSWHGGLAGSIPLSIAGGDKVLSLVGLAPIPLTETIFAAGNWRILAALLIVMPLTAWWMRDVPGPGVYTDRAEVEPHVVTSYWLENSKLPMRIFAFFGLIYLVWFLVVRRTADLNLVNLAFLLLSAILLGNMNRFIQALQEAVKNVGGILIQYPLYAGVMGMMQASGLGDQLSSAFVHISDAQSFPMFAFLSAGVVNFFVPSGGGQWAVQGPVLLKAAQELNVAPAKIAMCVAWGDAWTNLVQPFWALPLLSLAGLKLKDIMGPCVIYTLVSGVVIALGILLW